MSVVWRTMWLGASQDDRIALVNLAREAEALSRLVGSPALSHGASTLNYDGSADDFSLWTDDYSGTTADNRLAMPLSVAFAGATGWDPRAMAELQALQSEPPTWATLRADAANRVLPNGIPAQFDWWASRGEQLTRSTDQNDIYASRAQRNWWSQELRNWTTRGASTSSSSGGVGFAVAVILAAFAWSRKRRG